MLDYLYIGLIIGSVLGIASGLYEVWWKKKVSRWTKKH